MTKKHQINIITAVATAKQKQHGFKPTRLTKPFEDGEKRQWKYHPKYFKQEIFEFNTLAQLYNKLKPYITGEHPDAEYSALMYGSFIEGTETPYGWQRININIEDNPTKYLILDIETHSPEYEGTSLDLSKIKQWMVATYPWFNDDTGVLLYQTASAGVVLKDSENHKTIRVRAIIETNLEMGITQDERKHALRQWMKHTHGEDFERHIDPVSHEKARMFFMAPPILVNTERLLDKTKTTDIVRLYEGEPVQYWDLVGMDKIHPQAEDEGCLGVPSSEATFDKSIEERKLFKKLKSEPTEYWWDKIGDGNRYKGHYYMLVSAYYKGEIEKWRMKLLQDRFKLGDKTPKSIDSVIARIEQTLVKSFDKPTELFNNHNIIEIDKYLLKDAENKIDWPDKGVVLQRLYEGAGKTESLKELVKKAKEENKTFLYIAPNTKPVITACEELGLTSYQGLKDEIAGTNKNGLPRYPYLGICYPSLDYLGNADEDDPNSMIDIKWDILCMDEIEQLLIFAICDNRSIMIRPEYTDGILRKLVERAELVIGMDARISDLTIQALEHWRDENVFDLYQQSKIKPWEQHNITMVESFETAIDYIITAVRKGQRVAVVSELDRSGDTNLEKLKDYVQEQTGKKGWAVDMDNKDEGISNKYINELGVVEHKTKKTIKLGKLEKDLKDGKISHIWASPVIQSAWSYMSYEAPFDLVVGLYPNSVLTAPNIVQHICRFRGTTRFVMHIREKKKYQPWEMYNKLHPPIKKEGQVKLDLGEFNARKKLSDKYDTLQKSHRKEHFIDIAKNRGAKVGFDNELLLHEDKQLMNWLRLNKEKAWELVKSRGTWTKYNKLLHQDIEEKRLQEDIYGFEKHFTGDDLDNA